MLVSTTMFETCYIMIRTITNMLVSTTMFRDMLHYDTYRYWGYNLHMLVSNNVGLHDNVRDMLHYDTYHYWGYNLHTTMLVYHYTFTQMSTTMFETCYIMIRTITGVITFTQHVGLHDNVRDMLHYDTYHYWGYNLHTTCWSPRQCSRHVTL